MARVRLRPITIEDAEACFRWISDSEVSQFLGLVQPARTLEQERAWIASILADRPHRRAFIIEDEQGKPIGTCGLRGIDSDEGSAFLGIMIGEPRLWNRGYGTAATNVLLDYAFSEVGLREVRLSCHPENQRALRCYEKAGFRRCSHFPVSGLTRDDVRMAIDRDQWSSVKKQGHRPCCQGG